MKKTNKTTTNIYFMPQFVGNKGKQYIKNKLFCIIFMMFMSSVKSVCFNGAHKQNKSWNKVINNNVMKQQSDLQFTLCFDE